MTRTATGLIALVVLTVALLFVVGAIDPNARQKRDLERVVRYHCAFALPEMRDACITREVSRWYERQAR